MGESFFETYSQAQNFAYQLENQGIWCSIVPHHGGYLVRYTSYVQTYELSWYGEDDD